MRRSTSLLLCLATALLTASVTPSNLAAAQERSIFIGRTNFSDFTKAPGTVSGEIILTSPEFKPDLAWDELIASWNVPPGVYLKVEARGIFPNHTTKYFMLSEWSDDLAHHRRESESGQKNADGTVSIDTLKLARHGGKAQLRITIGGPDAARPQLKFLGLSFCDSQVKPAPREPNRAAWGKTIEVPERRQGEYEGGGGWCSPTSLSMVLAYWSDALHRPEMNHTVTEVANAINDANLDGTGNWPFNTAYAGSFPGIRAYVTRFDDISELEDWIAAGITPIISVSSYLTNDRHSGQDNGHLIVCVGFTESGDMVANDPGVSVKKNIRARRVYPRERVINAWKKSKNAVYLVYPETATIPKNVSGHWDGK